MAFTTKNWTLNSYTNATWTDLVAEPATVAAITISAPGGSTSVQLRLEDSGVSQAVILPPSLIGMNESYTLDVRSLNVTGTQKIQFQADVAGAEVLASGVV